MSLREPEKRELKVLASAINFFGSKEVVEDFKLLVKGRELYAVSKDLWNFIKNSKNVEWICGIKLGEIGSRRLKLSLEGTFWLVKNEKKKVYVNEKGEMLFLYGRDVFKSSVEKHSEFEENEIVFVCNRFGDILGIGKTRFSSFKLQELDPERIVVENLVDRGEYIRQKKLYDSF